jgi:hypothetical protein
MRPTRVTCLVMLWLLSNSTWAFSQVKSEEQFQERKPRASTKHLSEEHAQKQVWQAEGFGQTEKDAINDALETLCDEITHYLFQIGLRDWQPGVNDIRSLAKPATKQANFEEPGLGSLEHVTVELELNDRTIQKFQKEARQQRASGRMIGLGKGLGMLVALLAALGGYFRLEEATKGYYTTWLRLTTVGFIGAAATGLWLIR